MTMPRAPRKASPKAQSKSAKLPVALAKRAEKVAATRKKNLAVQARNAIDGIRRRMSQIVDAFYDIGEALKTLKDPDVYRSIEYASFEQLVKTEFDMSLTQANRLVLIAERIPREQALKMGQSKAIALIGLADATPELDSPASLARRKSIKVPGGAALVMKDASANTIEQAAKKIRAATRKDSKGRGLRVQAQDQAFAQDLEKRVRALGAQRVTISAVARHAGRADLRIEHLSIDEVSMLKKAIGK